MGVLSGRVHANNAGSPLRQGLGIYQRFDSGTFCWCLVFLGGDAALAVWVGAAIIGLPQAWLATSMFSRFGAQAPTLLGIAKFSLSALLFGLWFAKASDPQPGAIFMGAIAVLVSSPVFYYLAAKDKVV